MGLDEIQGGFGVGDDELMEATAVDGVHQLG
jgi:hypothetical protein